MGLKVEGLKEAREDLKALGRTDSRKGSFIFQFKEDFEKEVKFLEERAEVNAPILSGELREKISSETKIEGKRVTGEILCDVPYALQVHEEEYTLGPVSEAQPATPEGGVGRKFIERVITHNSAAVSERLGKKQKEFFKKKEREAKK